MLQCSEGSLHCMEGIMASQAIETANTSLFVAMGQAWTGMRLRSAERRADAARKAKIARELATYTDRELLDLGISRDNIPDIIAGSFRRP